MEEQKVLVKMKVRRNPRTIIPQYVMDFGFPPEAMSLIRKIYTRDKKIEELNKKADLIRDTSACGQAPPVYHQTIEKAMRLVQENANLWNDLRGYVVKGSGKTLWQWAILCKFPVAHHGDEHLMNFRLDNLFRCIKHKME